MKVGLNDPLLFYKPRVVSWMKPKALCQQFSARTISQIPPLNYAPEIN